MKTYDVNQEICVDCEKPCHIGTGRFVNRYPHYGEDGEGWRCGVCAAELDSLYETEEQE